MLSKPKLRPGDRPYLDAFYSLNASRPDGFSGPQPIALSEILAFVNLMGIASLEERAKYVRLIQLLDHEYLDHHRKQAEQARAAAKNKN